MKSSGHPKDHHWTSLALFGTGPMQKSSESLDMTPTILGEQPRWGLDGGRKSYMYCLDQYSIYGCCMCCCFVFQLALLSRKSLSCRHHIFISFLHQIILVLQIEISCARESQGRMFWGLRYSKKSPTGHTKRLETPIQYRVEERVALAIFGVCL